MSFPNSSGSIEQVFTQNQCTGRIKEELKLQTPKAKVLQLQVSKYRLFLHLHNKKERQFLLNTVCCTLDNRVCKLPQEWSILCDKEKHWWLLIAYKLMPATDFQKVENDLKMKHGKTVLNSAIRTKSIDPRVQTLFTVYMLEGQTVEIGGKLAREWRQKLRKAADQLQSWANMTQPASCRPSQRIARHKCKRHFQEKNPKKQRLLT